ncbi:hypothetical protein BLNAU_23529 [Blattamonas nauphoetae]|uniref:Uncharacterized protein n=1 Tax=Blattamonas nauphoetae TaxID=2049346 RepID=A0ABQ9WQ05_9EUKA|nr:hypothetical protein BLNAU_23529 [Blattamonas nauphoetae]
MNTSRPINATLPLEILPLAGSVTNCVSDDPSVNLPTFQYVQKIRKSSPSKPPIETIPSSTKTEHPRYPIGVVVN